MPGAPDARRKCHETEKFTANPRFSPRPPRRTPRARRGRAGCAAGRPRRPAPGPRAAGRRGRAGRKSGRSARGTPRPTCVVLLRLARAGRVDEPAAGRTTSAAWSQQPQLRRRRARAKSASVRRHLMSGSRRTCPGPSRARRPGRRRRPGRNGSGCAAFACTTRTHRAPDAATVRASSSTRRPRTSAATIEPAVPHRGRHRRRLAARRRARVEDALAGPAPPRTRRRAATPRPARRTSRSPASGVSSGLPSSTTSPSGAKRPGSAAHPVRPPAPRRAPRGVVRRRLARSVSGGRRVVEPRPRFRGLEPVTRPASGRTSHAGCDSVTER